LLGARRVVGSMTYGLRVDDLGHSICLRSTLHFPRLADAMLAFENAQPTTGVQAMITEYDDGPRMVRIVCVGREEDGQVVWEMPQAD
jgi:hypothetical protein